MHANDATNLPTGSERSPDALQLDVAIIGAGHSGLSLSATLAEAGMPHRVLEAETIGASWSRRWDSFRLNTPNFLTALPGYRYDGPDPTGFATAPDVIDMLTGFARRRRLPVVEGCAVRRVFAAGNGYRIETTAGALQARCVVVATGEYRQPRWPQVFFSPAAGLEVVHSRDYRRPQQLGPGAVLVIGGGQSGAQIAQDLRAAGREVFWSMAERYSHIRRVRGRDSMHWWDMQGLLHRHVRERPEVVAGVAGALQKARRAEFPLVSGTGALGRGSSISLLSMHRDGIALLGKLEQLDGHIAHFRDVRPQIRAAVAGTRAEYKHLNDMADAHYALVDEVPTDDARYLPEEVYLDWEPDASPRCLRLDAAGIGTVVVATGFEAQWPWLDVPGALDPRGYPVGDYGVSPQPGLFFIGMYNLQRPSSNFLCNGGRDAAELLPAILRHLEVAPVSDPSSPRSTAGCRACPRPAG
jgi:putative flavoprotein involved in K+ transport